jgi:hypothetical protein
MGPRHRVVGDTREQAAQFDRRGEFAVLTKTARIVVATVSVTRNMGRTMPRRSAPSNPRFMTRVHHVAPWCGGRLGAKRGRGLG